MLEKMTTTKANTNKKITYCHLFALQGTLMRFFNPPQTGMHFGKMYIRHRLVMLNSALFCNVYDAFAYNPLFPLHIGFDDPLQPPPPQFSIIASPLLYVQ